MTPYEHSTWIDSYRMVATWWDKVDARACAAQRARGRMDDANARTERWDAQKPPVAHDGFGDRAVALVVPFWLAATAVGEMLLSRPVATWFAYRFLGEPTWAGALRWLLPASLFVLDIWLALLLDQNRRHVGNGGTRNWAVVALAVLVLTVLPALTLANQLATLPDVEPEQLTMFWLRTVALVGISLVLHATVVLSGRFIRSSLELYAYLAGRCVTVCAAASARRTHDRAESALRRDAAMYSRLQREHAASWPDTEFRPLPSEVERIVIQHEKPKAARGKNVERPEQGINGLKGLDLTRGRTPPPGGSVAGHEWEAPH